MHKIFHLILALTFLTQATSYATNSGHDLSQKINYYKKDIPASVADILKDGKGNFDPWNKERWADWYNENGEVIKPFVLDVDVKFDTSLKIWEPAVSPKIESSQGLFIINCQGITINGNGLIVDMTSPEQRLSLEELYTKGKDPWRDTRIPAFRYKLSEIVGIGPTVLKNITLKGFRRGVKVDNGGVSNHPLMVTDCKFIRDVIGFYTNGDNGVLQNCEVFENAYVGIYSGSSSHDNKFIGNTFRDNTVSQGQYSYADIIGDTFYNTVIENNNFLPSLVNAKQRLFGISIVRNMGENNSLRKNIPYNNVIRNNTFTGYSAAIIVGARMGRKTRNDVTGEGRDYAFGNLIESNIIKDSDIGIKINTDGNTIRKNHFTNVDNEIVLHCVFFSLKNTTIEYQATNSVKLWYVLDDYMKYKDWFGFADNLNGSIKKSEKLIEVHSKIQSPEFPSGLGSIFVLNPKNKGPKFMLEDHRMGLPMATARGEFSLELPGEEIVAIWDGKIARVNDTDYYSILIFDQNGTEINRCGLSAVKWGQLAVGHFTSVSDEMEIAVVPAEPINGKYPIYIFNRGYRVPKAILLEENANPDISISSNEHHELVVSFAGK